MVAVEREQAAAAVGEALRAQGPARTRRCSPGRTAWPRPPPGPVTSVLNAVTGFSGLAATLAALRAGRVLALANKESLIVGGPLVASLARPGQIVPVDSEHSAIAQCLRGGSAGRGGPAGADRERRAVPATAAGPSWSRSRRSRRSPTPPGTWGRSITINSATLVNKGLEVIEAHLLFGIGFDGDRGGGAPAVGGPLDGRVHRRVDDRAGQPARHADPDRARAGLAGPGRRCARPAVDWSTAHTWTFEPLDEQAFPAVRIAREAGSAEAPPRPPTTRPTRCASMRSWRAGSPSPGSSTSSPR